MSDPNDPVSGESVTRNQPGPLVENKDSVVHQTIYMVAKSDYCPCCNNEVLRNDQRFRCPECGKDPIHITCQDQLTGWCKKCAESDEQMRNNCGRLCLHIEGPKGVKRVFLFGQRTVQMGRAQENSLKGLGNGMEDCPHRPRANDMILRVVEANKDGSTGEHVERSLLISRVHGALMAARDGPREHMKIIDVGFNRKGSNNGTWVGNSQIRPWEWRELSDTEQVMIGRDNTRGLSGLGLTLRVLRGDRAAGNRIEAVAITRDDALKDTNQYVIVVREATIGFGQNMSICLGPYSAKVWARIRIDEAGQWAMRAEKDGPLGGMAGSDDTGYRTGLDGLSMKGGELSFSFSLACDRDFYS